MFVRSPRPHTGTFNIDTDEVHVGVELGELHGIFTLATAQFEHDGVLVLEILLMPVPLHIKRNMFHYRIGVLEHVLIGFHVGELRQLTFSHLLNHHGRPTMLVLNLTILDATQGVEELL